VKLARVLSGVGRTLIAAGTLILLFVAYQLWGTGIYTSRQQDHARDEFCGQVACLADGEVPPEPTTTTTDPATDPSTPATAPPVLAPDAPPPSEGEPAGQIVIPSVGVDWIFYQGVALSDLKKGPGHYPDTPMPGQQGNAAIAGHRTTYGAPFGNIDSIQAGDEIYVTTVQGTFTYQVLPEDQGGRQIVKPSAVEVLGQNFGDNRLTLTACHPKYSARERIIVVAQLKGTPLAATPIDASPVPVGEATLGSLSGERAPALPAVMWGLAAALVWFLAWLVGRLWRKWPAYAIAVPIFLVVLFFFFDNFARLLPANY
jgi:sortase A